MAIRIDGKAVSAQVRARVAGEVAALREKGVVPGLAVIIVGDDPASRVYVNNKKKACRERELLRTDAHLRAGLFLRSSRSRQIRRSCN